LHNALVDVIISAIPNVTDPIPYLDGKVDLQGLNLLPIT
jgi:hypothetical protein